MNAPAHRRGRSPGITQTEYLVVLTVIAIACIVVAGLFGKQIKAALYGSTSALQAAPGLSEETAELWTSASAGDNAKTDDGATSASPGTNPEGENSGSNNDSGGNTSTSLLAWLDDRIRGNLPPELAARFRGLENPNWEAGKRQALRDGSLLADITPVVGTTKAIVELATGEDPLTGEQKSRVAATASILLSLIPGGNAEKAVVEVEEVAVAGVRSGIKPAATEIAAIAKNTDTVWDAIKATQPLYEGTVLPKSFEMLTANGKVWVHGNATEHMAEYATSMLNRGVNPSLVNIATQSQLTSLQAAVNAAVAGGVPYGKLITVGGWELKFGVPLEAGQLPALIHALPK